jgi:hypothetical protein
MERRAVVRQFAWILAGAALQGCTPLRIITQSFPDEFKHDPELVARTLRAFAAAVVPGVDAGTADPARALLDHRYPFASYAAFFASDLSRRAARRYGAPTFESLTLEQRTAIVLEGLDADGTTRKLYRGAIYLTQVSIYAGIYDDDAGCALIDFRGRYRGSEISYDNPQAFLAAPLTATGNYA